MSVAIELIENEIASKHKRWRGLIMAGGLRLIPLFQVFLDVVAGCELPICADRECHDAEHEVALAAPLYRTNLTGEPRR